VSRRTGIIKTVRVKVDGGESPNAYVPLITAEVRVFWPPHTVTAAQVMTALVEAAEAALDDLGDHDWSRR
jgi:hypothetical protein